MHNHNYTHQCNLLYALTQPMLLNHHSRDCRLQAFNVQQFLSHVTFNATIATYYAYLPYLIFLILLIIFPIAMLHPQIPLLTCQVPILHMQSTLIP